ncbi:hypothetical protein [Cellulomonas sp. URHE0023]|uniref:hypothetical protein n=1 Tax=Cellulomonas sp. URHE0023 TaxID=1380354 RepID=UPI0004893DDA|nr:hypothetical protein [Cellulomonas sp. URHE0023]
MSRTGALVSSAVAALVAVGLWLLSGTISLATQPDGGLAAFVPYTGGALQRAQANTTSWLVGIAVLVAVVGALTVPVSRSRTGGWPVVVLALWFVSVAGAGLATLAMAEVADHLAMSNPGERIGAITVGGYWGVVWGWAVGLAVVLVQPRPLLAAASPSERAARLAGGTTALVGGLGWLVIGALRSWADGSVDLTDPTAVAAHHDASPWISTLLPVPGSWWAPLVTGGTPRVWLGAAVVAAVQGALAYVAARTMHRRFGRVAFTFAVWFSAVAAAVLATAAMYTGATAEELYQGITVVSQLVLVGGQFGVQYGWVGAVLALVVLAAVDDRSPAADGIDSDALTAA